MENLTGIDPFWVMGEIYKHMGYPRIKWIMVDVDEDHVKLEAKNGEVPYYLMTPKEQHSMFIYRYPKFT